MYNNPYLQNTRDRIDMQIEQLKQMKEQLPTQQPAINQTFQLAPSGGMKYANSIDEVQKELVYTDTPYFSNDLSVVWLKNTKGDIKTFEMSEIVQKDEKDLKIELLLAQIEELKKGIEHESSNADVVKSTKNAKSTKVSNDKSSDSE